ncbi:MAG: hypothetical protein AAF456_19830 [Planctomycetota bacterium]
MNPADSTEIELDELIGLFFDDRGVLGEFENVNADQLHNPARGLLDHSGHMTVTVEKYHGCPVNVKVLDTRVDGDRYSRRILLTKSTDEQVVQYGIVRLDLTVLAPDVRAEIESQQTPLGRILIRHNVLRTVKLENLFKINCGEELARWFKVESGSSASGRTAMIFLDEQPAIELLEIVPG